MIGQGAVQNQEGMIGALGGGLGSIFGGATGAAGKALSGIMNNPMLYIGGAVALLILIK